MFISIFKGDAVKFSNVQGTHSATADNGQFSECGGSSQFAAPWTCTTPAFTTAGTVGFHCKFHGSPGSGMYGTITVQDCTSANQDVSAAATFAIWQFAVLNFLAIALLYVL